MLTPHKIISMTVGAYAFNPDEKARNILDALELAGYCVMQKTAYPHNISEVCRDGEMRAM